MFRVENRYSGEGNWYKGNLHTHTMNSKCGKQELRDALAMYSHGRVKADFLAITDHNIMTDLSKYRDKGKLILYQGAEMKTTDRQILVIGLEDYIENDPKDFTDHQDIFNEANNRGALSIICHPHFRKEEYWPLDELKKLSGFHGVEIYNENISKNSTGRAVATDVWDELLSIGMKVWGFANDDAHHQSRIDGGFNMVLAGERSSGAILEALKKGSFYASTGVLLTDLSLVENVIHLEIKVEAEFRFIGKGGKVFARINGTSADYIIRGSEGYIRAEAVREDGRKAWTQPFFIINEE